MGQPHLDGLADLQVVRDGGREGGGGRGGVLLKHTQLQTVTTNRLAGLPSVSVVAHACALGGGGGTGDEA